MSPIHLVSDRNSLRKLLTFASGKKSQDWRVDVDMINDTMFFNQWEEFRLMLINGNQDSGFGHAFEDCVTTKESSLKDSIHHERIVSYELGGMKCLVRFEADAYLNDGNGEEERSGSVIPPTDLPEPKPSKPVLKAPYKLVHVISRGHFVNSDQLVEIKSCSMPPFKINKAIDQLWFSQTKHLCVGYHKYGYMKEGPEMKDMGTELEKWEVSNQDQLKNMVRVIKEIRDIARTAKKCTIICGIVGGMRCLTLLGREGGDMTIRREVVEQCWRKKGEGA
jgi:hypothetical protein